MEEKNFTKLIIALLALGLIVCIVIIFALVSREFAIKQVNLPNGKRVISSSASTSADVKYSVTTLSKEEADKIKLEAKTTCEKSNLSAEERQVCAGGTSAYYTNKAMSLKDAKVCTLIDEITMQQICIDGIMHRMALENVDENYCLQLSDIDSAISCTSEIYYYKAKNDPANAKTYCSRIKDRPFSLKCLKDFAK